MFISDTEFCCDTIHQTTSVPHRLFRNFSSSPTSNFYKNLMCFHKPAWLMWVIHIWNTDSAYHNTVCFQGACVHFLSSRSSFHGSEQCWCCEFFCLSFWCSALRYTFLICFDLVHSSDLIHAAACVSVDFCVWELLLGFACVLSGSSYQAVPITFIFTPVSISLHLPNDFLFFFPI